MYFYNVSIMFIHKRRMVLEMPTTYGELKSWEVEKETKFKPLHLKLSYTIIL